MQKHTSNQKRRLLEQKGQLQCDAAIAAHRWRRRRRPATRLPTALSWRSSSSLLQLAVLLIGQQRRWMLRLRQPLQRRSGARMPWLLKMPQQLRMLHTLKSFTSSSW